MDPKKTSQGCAVSSGEEVYPGDCEITQGLLKKAAARQQDNERGYVWRACLSKAASVKILLLDVDGVMTDGTIIYTHEGNEIKSFHTRDGLGLRLLREAGVEVGLITARKSEAVARRARDLSLVHVYQGVKNKLEVYTRLLEELSLRPAETAYMGDDWLDLPLLVRAGFSATPADAVAEVKQVVDYVAKRPGGRGAVREICDLIIEAKGERESLLARYLEK